MADLIPSLNSCLSRMTSGEKRFARRLESHLGDDYLPWYEIPVGKKRRYTDFIILHRLMGILLIEVKDWKHEIIANDPRPNKIDWYINTNKGLKHAKNPLEQAHECVLKLKDDLEEDPQLQQQKGKYIGKLICPWAYGVVFSNITRSQFERDEGAYEVIPEHKMIFKDEMVENVDEEEFQTRLWKMFDQSFKNHLTDPQIDRIRWHIFPEIRIQQPSLFENIL